MSRHDQRGVSMMAIILFGTLSLSVVLLNAIAINIDQNTHAQSGRKTAVGFCGQPHPNLPAGCQVSEVYNCGDHYLLKNNCLGTGDIVLDINGKFVNWCGYASLDGPATSCQAYWRDAKGQDCRLTKNLCI
ncbi:MAG: hypothetical protein WC544_00925 [Patescibacteria group bacterium]